MDWLELVKYISSGVVGALLSTIVMLIRERNNFSAKMMDLFIQDKKSWVDEREKLEARVDGLYEKYDDLRDKYVDLATRQPTIVAVPNAVVTD
jgi:hypothetical protein